MRRSGDTIAAVMAAPGRLALSRVPLAGPGVGEVRVAVEHSAISTGTERLLWTGAMPTFPGMGYPLVPGYEAVGRIVEAGEGVEHRLGERVFAPGSKGFGEVRGLFGAAAACLVTPAARTAPVPDSLGDRAVLLALAATARHALAGGSLPELIVGHGVLGRLLARVAVAMGGAPVVWERLAARRDGAVGYSVVDPADDDRRDYRVILDASGDPTLVDTLIGRLAHGGELVLAGFYSAPIAFAFPPAFMREARLRIAAEWTPADLEATSALVAEGALSLDGLITHRAPAGDAAAAYATAFGDPDCLKMVLDWRDCA
ncbi:MAG: chlorophyll synthesis pathway protein BchC [Caulobacteraceae bacterium]|nr:chlorophyll synthesis pathway protein BchC [Caulobacter sp.]